MAAREPDPGDTPPRQRRLPCWQCWSLAGAAARGCALGLLLCMAVEVGNHLFRNNLHVVIPGRVYRCGQPSAAELEWLVRAYGIRTIINLRGNCETQPWYHEECRAAHRLDISLEDVGLSAGQLPPVQEVRRLVEVLDRSEYPVLFHCFRGVDRTGLASSVALLLLTDSTVKQARRALSLRYAHLPWGRTGRLDRFFELYEEWLRGRERAHSRAAFREWALHGYRGGACSGRLEVLGPALLGPEALPHAAVGPPAPDPTGEPGPRTLRVPRSEPFALRVRCHNTSSKTWRLHPNSNAGIHPCWSLLAANGMRLGGGRGGRFHAEVPPGSSIDVTLALPALIPGIYTLQLDLIEEQHAFFHQVGSEPLELRLEVP